jgi:Kef-type K+ transport system membrane component KefB
MGTNGKIATTIAVMIAVGAAVGAVVSFFHIPPAVGGVIIGIVLGTVVARGTFSSSRHATKGNQAGGKSCELRAKS